MTNFPRIKNHQGINLAYDFDEQDSDVVTVFLGGYASDMLGSKAEFFKAECLANKQSFLRLDYSAHGQSEGDFSQCTIAQWLQDVICVIDHTCANKELIIIGSSLGGWLMLLAALHYKNRVVGLMGLAAAPDFTERLYHHELSDAQRLQLDNSGEVIFWQSTDGTESLSVTKLLIEDAKKQLLLDAEIAINCPVILNQGMDDTEVPWQTCIKLSEKLQSTQVEIKLIKHADHRLSSESQLVSIVRSYHDLRQMIAKKN